MSKCAYPAILGHREVLQISSDGNGHRGAKNKTQKFPGPNINPKKILYRTYAATHTGTTMNLQIVLNTQKNPYLNQVTQENSCQIFRPPPPPQKKKIFPVIKNFKPKKSFNHPCDLKPRAPPLGFGEPE